MIRFATPLDADAIAEIHVHTWRAAYDGIVPAAVLGSLSVATRAEGWKRGIELDPRHVLVAEHEGRMAGWIAVGPCRDADAKADGEIFAVYVRPSCWGAGVGQALMSQGEAELWSRGLPTIVLWVLELNERARRFYNRFGYTQDGAAKDVTLGETTLKEIRYRKERAPQSG